MMFKCIMFHWLQRNKWSLFPSILQLTLGFLDHKKYYFMYSIHNMDIDETPNQLVEEPSPNLMYIIDDLYYLDNIPKYDQYDDDYVFEIDANCSKQLVACFWEKEAQLQLKYDNHPMHINYDNNKKNAENIKVSGKSLSLCFSSFQFLRENYQQVVNNRDGECFYQSVEDVIDDMEVVLDPELQPLSYIDF